MAKKFYAVKNGRKIGVYTSWDICKQQIIGFSGAVYKGFNTEREAMEFLAPAPARDNTEEDGAAPMAVSAADTAIGSVSAADAELNAVSAADTAVAYVDGSYSNRTGEFACGIVLFYQNIELRLSQKYSNSDDAAMRNVAGEIKGAEKAMRFCAEKGIKNLELYHDYEGVARWCTGEWKANKQGVKDYKSFYDSLAGRLNVTFHKVTGHSGNTYNDAADQLARAALGL